MPHRILVIANKTWEAAPLVGVMMNAAVRPDAIANVCMPTQPQLPPPGPRLTLTCSDMPVEVWCVQDLMSPNQDSSSTQEKARVIPPVWKGRESGCLVVAFGTAACPWNGCNNGSVVIGTSVFVHDPYKEEPGADNREKGERWSPPSQNRLVHSTAAEMIGAVAADYVPDPAKRLLAPPNGPATPPTISANNDLVAIGVVNVLDYTHYKWADLRALEHFNQVATSYRPGSVETTHGVVRLLTTAPFIYVSGFANEVGKYAQHVEPNRYVQNFVAAHNAAVATAWLLPELATLLRATEHPASGSKSGRLENTS